MPAYILTCILQDSGEAHSSDLQEAAEPEVSYQRGTTTTFTNGNGNSLQRHEGHAEPARHQFPAYPSYSADNSRLYPEWSLPEPVAVPRSVTADSSRLYPEWSLPEPVAVPRGLNGSWAPSWSQHQGADTEQPQPQTTTQPIAPHMPSAAQTGRPQQEQLKAAQPQMPQSLHAQSVEGTQSAGLQQPDIHMVSALGSVPYQDAAAVDTSVEQQLPHPSVSQVSLHQPPTSGQAAHQLPAAAAAAAAVAAHGFAEQSQAVPTRPEPSSSMHHDLSSEPQQQQQQQQQHQQLQQQPPQQAQQQLQQQLEQQPQHQQSLLQDASAVDVLPGTVEQRHQQPGAGPSDAGQVTIGPNVGAYSQRELYLQNLEQAGEMSFEYVLNDGQRHNSIW